MRPPRRKAADRALTGKKLERGLFTNGFTAMLLVDEEGARDPGPGMGRDHRPQGLSDDQHR
jgi:hypothetical protein